MVKHIILWKLNENLSDTEKKEVSEKIKKGLEGLLGKIDGLNMIKVRIDKLDTSTCDLMLDSEFETFEAYKGYKTNPLHVSVANGVVRPNVSVRLCIDYEF